MQTSFLPAAPEGFFSAACTPMTEGHLARYAQSWGPRAADAAQGCRHAAQKGDNLMFLRAMRALSNSLPPSCWEQKTPTHNAQNNRGPRPQAKGLSNGR